MSCEPVFADGIRLWSTGGSKLARTRAHGDSTTYAHASPREGRG